MTAMKRAEALMEAFAQRTGLEDQGSMPRRYLWTDAFAVCTFLGLYERTQERRYRTLAKRLVAQVHEVLGRFAPEDERSGWISGLEEEQAIAHPTAGGLRIGKALPERAPDAPFDERLEWERDGQYFHYLTRWMHALSRMSQVLGDPRYNRWAMEMAKAIHPRFVYRSDRDGALRMYWKMSVDLSRPQVASMGMHDPLDGLLSYLELVRVDAGLSRPSGIDLNEEIAQMLQMVRQMRFVSDDPLGIGGLLGGATLLSQIMSAGVTGLEELERILLASAAEGLGLFVAGGTLEAPAEYRLGFREFGVSIGLKGVRWIGERHLERYRAELERVFAFEEIAQRIEAFWLDEAHQASRIWQEHRDINEVMLATSLVPQGYLECRCGG